MGHVARDCRARFAARNQIPIAIELHRDAVANAYAAADTKAGTSHRFGGQAMLSSVHFAPHARTRSRNASERSRIAAILS